MSEVKLYGIRNGYVISYTKKSILILFILSYHKYNNNNFNNNFTKQYICDINVLSLVFDYL